MEVLDSLILVETPEKIFIHPSTLGAGTRFMVINRISDEIVVSADPAIIPDSGRIRTISIGGIIGVIDLVAGPYLVVIISKIRKGEISTHGIWQLNQYEIIPFRRTILHLSETQAKHNTTYLEMLNTVLTTPNFYFSYTYDLCQNLQGLEFNSPDFFNQTLIERAETKFLWNSHLLQKFQGRPELHKFCVPIIHGFVSINPIDVNSKNFKFIIISRRSSKRPGTRMFSRGIDSDGNVSNFVETEQIVEYNGDITSFVQIRGSIPLFWTQKPNLRYKPKPTLSQRSQNEAFTKHFEDLCLKYGRIVCVDLVNQTGSEAPLETAFRRQFQSSVLPNVRYEAFDFHHECRSMRWERTEILMNRLSVEVEEFGYFVRSRGQRQNQEGVFRTNCIDCLDRTNVIQGLLGRVNFERVLKMMGILNDQERISSHPIVEYLFKNIWADNGDICSIEYSGTGALKTDFTRTGKRTFRGLMQDGYNSAVRYIKNNFSDGFRQDAMDLFLGNFKVEEQTPGVVSPLDRKRDWKFYMLPLWLILSVVMLASSAIYPSEYSTEYFMYIFCWGLMVLATSGFIIVVGPEFVDNPVLTDANGLTM